MEPISDLVADPESERESGRRKMEWARQHMPILASLREEFTREQPLAGETVGMAMHVEAKTAVLAELLADAGAQVAITGCNPLSTHEDVSVALDSHERVTSYARRGVDDETYYAAIEAVIAQEPTITVDDGMDMVAAIHEDHPELVDTILGGCEETTTGVHRLRAMADDGELRYPVFASTCIAIPTTCPRNGRSASNVSRSDARMGMCSRAHDIFVRPDSRAVPGSFSCSVTVGYVITRRSGRVPKNLPNPRQTPDDGAAATGVAPARKGPATRRSTGVHRPRDRTGTGPYRRTGYESLSSSSSSSSRSSGGPASSGRLSAPGLFSVTNSETA